jgi:hypothetical protein
MRALLVFTFIIVIMGAGLDEASARPIAAKGGAL